MAGTTRFVWIDDDAAFRARVEALVAGCSPAQDVIVIASHGVAGVEASVAAHPGRVVWLVPALTPPIVALAHRLAVPACAVEHGLAPVAAAIARPPDTDRRARELAEGEQRVLELVAGQASLEDALTELVRLVERMAPPAIGSVLRLDADGVHLRRGAAPGLPEAYNRAIDGAPIGPAAGSCGTSAALRAPVVALDTETDPRWASYRALARLAGVRACWSTPILGTHGRVLGTFACYYRDPRAPTDEDLQLLARLGHVAGIAIQRHELDDQLRQLSTRLEEAREDERTGIAREIHDQLGQGLTVLKMDLAWIARRASSPDGLAREPLLAKLGELLGQADQIIAEVRRISAELRPGILDDLGLDAALVWAASEFERRTQIACVVRTGLADDERVQRDVATAIFRVFQEALTNVVRHAQAHRVDVYLEEHRDALELRISDDGVGIHDEAIHDPRSLGLLGIRERARRLGGEVSFRRGDDGGTVVTLRVPLSRALVSGAPG